MIEKIHNGRENNKNIDNIEGFRLPKNVRQIGQPEGQKKIFVEDYVMTYIRQLAMKDYTKYKVAILLGNVVKKNGYKNIFILGAIEAYPVNIDSDVAFENETWTSIYDTVKTYFDNMEIIGWYIAKPGLILEENDHITKTHINNFAGVDKMLLLYDSIEKEENFYIFEQNKLVRQLGYYIYYEKNEPMQNYMVEHKEIESEEVYYEDRAIKEIRNIIESKKEVAKKNEHSNNSMVIYGASTILAAGVLIIGATMLNNYDKMKTMEKTLNVISDHVVSDFENITSKSNDDKVLEVKTTKGEVEKINEEIDEQLKDKTSKDKNKETNKETNKVENKETNEVENKETNQNENKEINKEENEINKKENKNEQEKINKESNESKDDKKITGGKTTKSEIEEKPIKAKKIEVDKTVTTSAKVKAYVVKEGDTLASISKKFYGDISSLEKIMDKNKIEDKDKIIIGQKIIIP